MRLDELARRLECRLEGDGSIEIQGLAAIAEAGPGELAPLTDSRYLALAAGSKAAAWLVGDTFPVPAGSPPLLRAQRPDLALIEAIRLLRPAWRPEPGIHPTASIHPTARLGANSHVGAYAVIGEGCVIGDGAILHPHVVLYPNVRAGARLLAHAHVVIREDTVLGDDVILQPGVVLGGDGFGFVRRDSGSYAKVPQVGGVRVEDGVEIQANSCVDRGTLSTTRIGAGTRLDNLVHVAHNCDLDADILLCAQVGLAGSTVIGKGAVLAGQVGVAGHCTIGPGAIITAQSGTHGDLPGGEMYSGSPAFAHPQWLRATAVFARLPDLQKTVRELKNKIK